MARIIDLKLTEEELRAIDTLLGYFNKRPELFRMPYGQRTATHVFDYGSIPILARVKQEISEALAAADKSSKPTRKPKKRSKR